jgi:segregation and condensation protein A
VTHKVNIDVYEGPLDLLLFLIKKSDLNIFDVPVSQITGDYLATVELMKELQIDVAGEFLVMAATLMQIKARMLLPAQPAEGEEGPDPRAELVNRLVEYQRYKEAARVLEAKLIRQKDVHFKPSPLFSEGDYTMEASLFDLLDAFRDVLKNLRPEVRDIALDEIPIEVKIREILSFLTDKPFATFRDILKREETRRGLIATFLAVLELIRLKQIVARQMEHFGEIRVYRMEALPEEIRGESPEPASEATPSAPLPEISLPVAGNLEETTDGRA